MHGEAVRRSGQGAPEHWDWLAQLPAQRLLLAHGAPWDEPRSLHCEYVYPVDTARLGQIARGDAEIVVLGHTHFPMLRRHGDTLVINPGSCGEARDQDRLTFGLIDTAAEIAVVYRLDRGDEGEVFQEMRLPERWAEAAS